MNAKKPISPRVSHERAAALEHETDETNPRNVPVAPLDATPPHRKARKPARPATAGQDVPMDTEMLIDPPPNAPHLGHERING